MADSVIDDLMPVLVADLADDESRQVLESVAAVGGRMVVPLLGAPADSSRHILEVYTPGFPEPLLFHAYPDGAPTAQGFPLRLRRAKEPGGARPSPPAPQPAAAPLVDTSLRPRGNTLINMTASHTAELSHEAAPETQLVGRTIAGKLLIEELIGQGGVGAVYRARHRALRMPVALKVLHESFQKDLDFCNRFYAEALAASKLDHPNLTRVIDFGQEPDGLLYFAMEFLDGIDLRTVLDRDKRLRPERIAELMIQVCAGLSHAHARGIIHRDIKPENLVIIASDDDDGEPMELVKVCDFGIAQQRGGGEEGLAGTPEYMSPEQCSGDKLDARSDVYACGVVLYELATGQVPFQSEKAAAVLNMHMFKPPLAPSHVASDVDPLLEKMILKALNKKPEARQQHMRELRAELRELLASTSPSRSSVRGGENTETLSRRDMQLPPAGPDWLERGSATYGTMPTTATTPDPRLEDASDTVARESAAWLTRLVQMPDPVKFGQAAASIEGMLRHLASRGDAATLWTMCATLDGVAMEGTQATGSRAQSAAKALRLFEDPAMLAPIAEKLLVGTDDARDPAKRLLVWAGVAGAYALYGARAKLAAEPNVRPRFVQAMCDFGRQAWPVAHAALERTQEGVDGRAAELAEDLLRCTTAIADESAGHLIVKYLRSTVPGVCLAATASIVRIWGERARPLLLGMLQSKDDVPRAAGIAGLRELGGIDERVVPRLAAILARTIPAGDELRAAAANGLAHTAVSARPAAISVLSQTLAQKGPPPIPRRDGTPSKEDLVVLAIARSLVQIAGRSCFPIVAERADRAGEPLRTHLRKLVSA